MITDEKQYHVTRAQADRFREALDGFDEAELVAQGVDATLAAAQRSALMSQLDDLEGELVRYRRLTSGDVRDLPLAGISDIGTSLIEARIIQGLSQQELGRRLGMDEGQIRRYEQDGYRTVDLTRCAEVAEALDLDLRAHLTVRAASKIRPPSAAPRGDPALS